MSAEVTLDLDIPPPVRELADAVHTHGGRTWVVGGGVRDHLLGQHVKDHDIEVHGIQPDLLVTILRRLGRVNEVGKAFGVFKFRPRGSAPTEPEIDISIPRRDSNNGPGHKGIAVVGDPFMPLDDAVRRRDLTINAMLVDVRTGVLHDLVGGLDDLQNQRLAPVDAATFLDDPLRALRVVQFAARTGFQPTGSLLALCRRAPLDELPAERIQLEWGKLLLKGHALVHGLQVARAADLLRRVFPRVQDDPRAGVALERAVGTRDALDSPGRAWTLMLTVWLSGSPSDVAEAVLDTLWLHRVGGYDVRRQVLAQLAHEHDAATTDRDLRWLSTHVELEIALAVRAARNPDLDVAPALARAIELGIEREPPPVLLQGRDWIALGIRPGKELGEWVRKSRAAQLDGVFQTHEEGTRWASTLIG